MSYVLPLTGTPTREAIDMPTLVAYGTGDAVPVDLQAALRSAKRLFENKAVSRVFSIVLRADDKLQLISIGPRGGWKVEWNFGSYQLPSKLRGR